jgi:uncharacterized membrane protein YkvA (DUF1232 family)
VLTIINRLKARAKRLKQESFALYLAARDPRTPWYARLLVVCIVAYALSPIDLIPDPIPILGYVDDLLLLPLGIYLALKLIPEPVLTDCRQRALASEAKLPRSLSAAIVIVLLWIAAVLWLGKLALRFIGR